jgi:DNA primase
VDPDVRALVSTRETPRQRKWVNFPLVNDELALLWMVNMGCIDMNTWYSRVDKPDAPDFVLFDLDPRRRRLRETVQVALLVKEALDALGSSSFPKTSGADGMHVLVPIERRTRTTTRARSRRSSPARSRARTAARDDRVDEGEAARRADRREPERRGKTIASVYSVRPKEGAPVSTPLRWDEVNDKLNPAIYSMEVVLDRVRRYGDLYEGVLTTRQSLAKALEGDLVRRLALASGPCCSSRVRRRTSERRDGARASGARPADAGACRREGRALGRAFASPRDETLLAQWSAECEVPIAFFVQGRDWRPRPVRGTMSPRRAMSIATAGRRTGAAIVEFPAAACGNGIHKPGIYLVALDGRGRSSSL